MEYTHEMGKRICERLASGENLTNSCAEEQFTRQRFFRELLKNEKLADEYARAREARAHAHAEDIDDIKAKLLNGEIDAQTARILFDATRWQAGHEKPKIYGDKLDVTGVPGSSVNVLLSTREKLKKLKRAREDEGAPREIGGSSPRGTIEAGESGGEDGGAL